ncbi:MAG: HD domain-containing protein [bacterium]|nr:HD domain-containing protein [bacterium]
MPEFSRWVRLMELTRSMPQTGYALVGLSKHDLSDLAQHHYLVTVIAWQLARRVHSAGIPINLTRVLECALVHDLGELTGGDISTPYAKANPDARAKAKAFEEANQLFISRFFGADEPYIQKLFIDVNQTNSDESRLYKLADYIEVTHYKLYVNRLSRNDVLLATNKIEAVLQKMLNPQIRAILTPIIEEWANDLRLPPEEIFEEAKAAE